MKGCANSLLLLTLSHPFTLSHLSTDKVVSWARLDAEQMGLDEACKPLDVPNRSV